MTTESSIMTRQAVALGITLFIILTVVAYIIFPVLFQGQIDAAQTRLTDHSRLGAHDSANAQLDAIKIRVVALEAAMQSIDSTYNVPVSFVPVDTTQN